MKDPISDLLRLCTHPGKAPTKRETPGNPLSLTGLPSTSPEDASSRARAALALILVIERGS